MPPPPAAPDPAWSAYDDAFGRAARGDAAAARTQLMDLSARWPHHPAGERAGSLVQRYAARDTRSASDDPQRPSGLARGELVFWSTVSGGFMAANVCELVGCNSSRATAAVITGTVGGSLAVSLLATRNGIRAGQAQLYNAAQTWGSWNALGVNGGFADSRQEASVALASQGLGLAVGAGLWKTWRPTQGDVALANTALVWSSLLGVWTHLMLSDREPELGTIVLIGDAGLIAGALLSTQVKMSRGRTMLIDTGGVIGVLGGALVAIGEPDNQTIGTALLVSTAAGLGIATVLTRGWDDELPVSLAPAVIPGTTPGTTAFGLAVSLHH